MLDDSFDFSFSGLRRPINYVRKHPDVGSADVAVVQMAVVDVPVASRRAAASRRTGIVLGGRGGESLLRADPRRV